MVQIASPNTAAELRHWRQAASHWSTSERRKTGKFNRKNKTSDRSRARPDMKPEGTHVDIESGGGLNLRSVCNCSSFC